MNQILDEIDEGINFFIEDVKFLACWLSSFMLAIVRLATRSSSGKKVAHHDR